MQPVADRGVHGVVEGGALLAGVGGELGRETGSSSATSQVCATKSVPASARQNSSARATFAEPPVTSSAKEAIASKPR